MLETHRHFEYTLLPNCRSEDMLIIFDERVNIFKIILIKVVIALLD